MRTHALAVAALSSSQTEAPFARTGILVATLCGIGMCGDYPNPWTLIGAVVIIAAGLYVCRSDRNGAGAGVKAADVWKT